MDVMKTVWWPSAGSFFGMEQLFLYLPVNAQGRGGGMTQGNLTSSWKLESNSLPPDNL